MFYRVFNGLGESLSLTAAIRAAVVGCCCYSSSLGPIETWTRSAVPPRRSRGRRVVNEKRGRNRPRGESPKSIAFPRPGHGAAGTGIIGAARVRSTGVSKVSMPVSGSMPSTSGGFPPRANVSHTAPPADLNSIAGTRLCRAFCGSLRLYRADVPEWSQPVRKRMLGRPVLGTGYSKRSSRPISRKRSDATFSWSQSSVSCAT
jgi:hypothetical protein